MTRVLLAALALGAAVVALDAPRLTWRNDGLRVSHPSRQAVAALAGAGLVGAAAARAQRRIPLLGAALLLALVGADRLAFAVEATDLGLRQRTLLGSTRIAWPEVEAVEPLPGGIRVRARGGARIDVATRRLAAADRARLERTIARRVHESAR